ncbi:MAG: uroporphyrinogen-III synthase [Pseudomonadota bacterium]
MSAPSLPIIVTRAEPGASETAARLHAMGAQVLVSPVLSVQTDPSVELPDLSTVSGLVFTSANGVRALAERNADRTPTAWCVGPATAAAAREAGFAQVFESAGNAVDLANYITAHTAPNPKPLLHVANAAAKGDLKATLEGLGFTVTFAPLYAMQPATALAPDALSALQSERACIVLIHSAKGAERFAKLAQTVSVQNTIAVAISEAALAPLAALPLSAQFTATAPNEDGLFTALTVAIATLSA